MSRVAELIGVPLDLGQTLRGVDLGPGALRHAGLDRALGEIGFEVLDRGNVPVPVRGSLKDQAAEHYRPAIAEVCEEVYRLAQSAVSAGHIPLFLGGDHSLAVGSVAGVSAPGPVGLLWVDAHGDFNTAASSPSGNIHGMALALLLGEGHRDLVDLGHPGPKILPQQVVLFGVRQLDQREKERLAESGIHIYTMRDIDERGMAWAARAALDHLADCRRLHLSLDLDAIDPAHAAGVGTPVPGGLSYREAELLMEILADTGRLGSLDLVEINPMLDQRNQTAELAVALAASALGKRIF